MDLWYGFSACRDGSFSAREPLPTGVSPARSVAEIRSILLGRPSSRAGALGNARSPVTPGAASARASGSAHGGFVSRLWPVPPASLPLHPSGSSRASVAPLPGTVARSSSAVPQGSSALLPSLATGGFPAASLLPAALPLRSACSPAGPGPSSELQRRLQGLRVPAVRAALWLSVQPRAAVSCAPPGRVAAVRQRGLASAAAVLAHSVRESTLSKQQAAGRELSTWLVAYGDGASLLDCTPDDVLIYMMEWWIPNHRGRRVKGGPPTAAAIHSHLSLLSGLFQRLGRGTAYDPCTGQGNPCASPEISDYRRAYPRMMARGGLLPVSAKPLSEPKYRALVSYLWAQVRSARCLLARLLLLRDLLCAQYMWLSSMRGHDTGKLCLSDFVSPADRRSPFAGFPLPLPRPPEPYLPTQLCVAELITKTYQTGRAPAITLSLEAEPSLCFIRTLAIFQQLSLRPDAPPGAFSRHYLFKPLRSDRRGFKEAALSSSTLGARLRLHLTMASLYEGEACHSFRRGTLQAAAAQGIPRLGLQAFAQLRSESVLRRYLDPERHLADRDPKRRRL